METATTSSPAPITLAVLGAAYPKKYDGPYLNHSYVTGAAKSLCGKIREAHLGDAPDGDEAARPSCPSCAKKDPRFAA